MLIDTAQDGEIMCKKRSPFPKRILYAAVSLKRGPHYRSQYVITLMMGNPKHAQTAQIETLLATRRAPGIQRSQHEVTWHLKLSVSKNEGYLGVPFWGLNNKDCSII